MPVRTVLLLAILLFINASAYAESRKGNFIPEQSLFHVLAYSDGLLSGLGHDHVITATKWRGSYEIKNETDLQAFIEVDVQGLVVDTVKDRKMYPHLANKDQPSAEDIAGTKNNMHGRDVLDVRQYPVIQVWIKGDTGTKNMSVRLGLHGQEAETVAQYTSFCENGVLMAKGKFSFSHADFGLDPFAALFGAIKVAEKFDFHFLAATSEKCSM